MILVRLFKVANSFLEKIYFEFLLYFLKDNNVVSEVSVIIIYSLFSQFKIILRR